MTGLASMVALAPLLLGACGDSESSDEAEPATTAESTTSTTSAGGAVNAAATIGVTEFAFTPEQLEVAPGEAVTFQNDGSSRHTITPGLRTAGSADPWVSTTIRQGETFVVTMSEPGEYAYYCSIHPDRMEGTITISE
jgi:plastocyanin